MKELTILSLILVRSCWQTLCSRLFMRIWMTKTRANSERLVKPSRGESIEPEFALGKSLTEKLKMSFNGNGVA